MDEPLVSIGIPVYNCEATLPDAIRSIFAQSYENWELILFDDGSDDASYDIANSIEDHRVTVCRNEKNRGICYCLNRIAKHANGKYLARMDADDLMHPDRIRQQVAYLDAHTDTDFVGCPVYIVNSANQVTGIRGNGIGARSVAQILEQGLVAHPTVTGRTEWFLSNPYDGRFVRAEDVELWCRTFGGSVFRMMAEPLFFYREGELAHIGKYLKSCETVRKIVRIYGPPAYGWPRTVLSLLKSYGKSLVYQFFSFLDSQHRLVSMRSRCLEPEDREKADKMLHTILTTAVPGLN